MVLRDAPHGVEFGMSRVKHNILANVFGRGWASLNFILFTPLYLHLLGAEAYGMIGFFATFQAVMFLLDAGLSTSLNRELARSGAGSQSAVNAGTLLRTLEIVYLLLAVGTLVLVAAASTPISRYWLHSQHFDAGYLAHILILMGLAMALQFPTNLYEGGLYGLQRQVLANAIASVFVTLRYGGAALLLWVYHPTLEVFFGWAILIAGMQTVVTRRFLWRALPVEAGPVHFSLGAIKSIRHFAAGMMGFSVTSTLYLQVDKVLLSSLLPLRVYGYYMLAATAAAGLRILIAPVYNAFFPRMTELVEHGLTEELRDLYHRGCQLITVIIVPVATGVALFAPAILKIWTNDDGAVQAVSMVLGLLAISVLVNAMQSIPMAFQLAYGWVALLFKLRVVTLVLVVPVLIYSVRYYGISGAATALICLELLYAGLGMVLMHRRLLPGDLGRWLLKDILVPGGIAVLVVAIGAGGFQGRPETVSEKLWMVGVIMGTLLAAMAAASSSVTWVRKMLLEWVRGPLGHN